MTQKEFDKIFDKTTVEDLNFYYRNYTYKFMALAALLRIVDSPELVNDDLDDWECWLATYIFKTNEPLVFSEDYVEKTPYTLAGCSTNGVHCTSYKNNHNETEDNKTEGSTK